MCTYHVCSLRSLHVRLFINTLFIIIIYINYKYLLDEFVLVEKTNNKTLLLLYVCVCVSHFYMVNT